MFNSLKKYLSSHGQFIVLSGLFILAAALRFYRLDERCLFGDEVLTLNIISGASWREVWQKVTELYATDLPLYYVILHYWGLVSSSLFWMRSFSVVITLLSLFVVYRFCVYLFDKKVALLVVYLRAISPIRIIYSQTIRYYSLISLVNIVSLYFFIKAVRLNTKSRWVLYIIARGISLYINHVSLLFLFCEGLFIWLYDKKYPFSSKRWLVSVLTILALWFPMAFYFFRDFNVLLCGEGFQRIPLQYGPIANFFYTFFAFSLGQTILPFDLPVVLISGIIYLFILIRFFRAYFRKDIPREHANLLLLVLFVIVALCSLSSYNSPRYILAAAMMYGIIISVGILKNPRRLAVALIVAVSLLRCYSLYNLYTERQYHTKEMVDDWDEIASYVKNNSSSDTLVIYNSVSFGYYLNLGRSKAAAFVLPKIDEEMPVFKEENLEPHKDSSRIIFVDSPLSGSNAKDYEYEIAILGNWLKAYNFKLREKKGFDQEVWVEQKRKFVNRLFPEYRTTVYMYTKK